MIVLQTLGSLREEEFIELMLNNTKKNVLLSVGSNIALVFGVGAVNNEEKNRKLASCGIYMFLKRYKSSNSST
jgi:hypothetical protein